MGTSSIVASLEMLHKAMGISYSPSETHSLQGGIDAHGKVYYTDPKLANDNNPQAGIEHVDAFTHAYSPFGVLSDNEYAMLDHVKNVSSDGKILQDLNDLQSRGATSKEKTVAILNKFNPNITSTSQVKDSHTGLNGTITAYSLANTWGTLSDAQKAVGLATVGIQGIHPLSGNNLNDTEIPGSQSLVDGKGVPVGAATEMFKGGINAYALGKNWPQIDVVGKIAYGTKDLAQGVQVGGMLGMLGTGTEGSTVNITSQQLAKMGATPAPEYGIGAINLARGSSVPNGYTLMHSNAGSVAIPSANAHSASINQNSTAGTVAQVKAIQNGTHSVVRNWGKS